MPQNINSTQVRDQGLRRNDLELDFADTGAVRAQDIPYDAVQSIKAKIDDVASGSSAEIEINNFVGDDTFPVTNSTLWNLIPAVNFPASLNGICYFNFLVSSTWNLTEDINFTLDYAMSTSEGEAGVKLVLDYWVVDPGQTPNPATPTGTSTQTIVPTDTGNEYDQIALTLAIAHADFDTARQMVMCRLTRDVSVGNNHGGDFQLIKLLAHQG